MKFFLYIFCAFAVMSCAPRLIPTVQTESKAGEQLTMQQVEKTGSRADVPAGKKARQVVSQTSLMHAGGNVGKIIITRGFWPWSEVDVYTNCAQCHKDTSKLVTIEQPKRPWYFWPAWVLIGLAVVAGIVALLYLRGLLAPVIGFLKSLLTRVK